MRTQRFPLIATTIAAAAILSLAACDRRQEDRTVGQKVDSAIAKVEQKTDQAAAEVKKDLNVARESTGKAMSDAGSKVKDAAITTSVNAELARDPSLSALKIDVDTSEGRVSLRGTAPDPASRDRATQLAQHVDGVVSVANDLQIRKN